MFAGRLGSQISRLTLRNAFRLKSNPRLQPPRYVFDVLRVSFCTNVPTNAISRLPTFPTAPTALQPDATIVDIPKEAISALPPLTLDSGKSIVEVREWEAVPAAIAALREQVKEDAKQCLHGVDARTGLGAKVVGFDTETRPQYQKGGGANPVALIQLASSTTCYLFHIARMQFTVHEDLVDFLADGHILKVGVGVRNDIKAMNTVIQRFDDNHSFRDLDKEYLRVFPSLIRRGLQNLSGTLLGRKMNKKEQMSNWACAQLSHSQISYAANDAFAGLELLKVLLGMIDISHAPRADTTAAAPEAAPGAPVFGPTVPGATPKSPPPPKQQPHQQNYHQHQQHRHYHQHHHQHQHAYTPQHQPAYPQQYPPQHQAQYAQPYGGYQYAYPQQHGHQHQHQHQQHLYPPQPQQPQQQSSNSNTAQSSLSMTEQFEKFNLSF